MQSAVMLSYAWKKRLGILFIVISANAHRIPTQAFVWLSSVTDIRGGPGMRDFFLNRKYSSWKFQEKKASFSSLSLSSGLLPLGFLCPSLAYYNFVVEVVVDAWLVYVSELSIWGNGGVGGGEKDLWMWMENL